MEKLHNTLTLALVTLKFSWSPHKFHICRLWSETSPQEDPSRANSLQVMVEEDILPLSLLQVPSSLPLAGRLAHFSHSWRLLTSDAWGLQTVTGFNLEFSSPFTKSTSPKAFNQHSLALLSRKLYTGPALIWLQQHHAFGPEVFGRIPPSHQLQSPKFFCCVASF